MPSDLQITNIKDQANANSAITIASDGQITVNQNNPTLTLGDNASGFTGIKVIDQWYITAGFSGTQNPITANLSRLTNASSSIANIGSAMTESSGVFTFPMTGKWLIKFHANQALNGSSRYTSIIIDSLISGTTTILAKSYNYLISSSNQTKYTNTHIEAMYDVTDTSTHKVKFGVDEDISNSVSYNSSGSTQPYFYTYMQFIRLGDT